MLVHLISKQKCLSFQGNQIYQTNQKKRLSKNYEVNSLPPDFLFSSKAPKDLGISPIHPHPRTADVWRAFFQSAPRGSYSVYVHPSERRPGPHFFLVSASHDVIFFYNMFTSSYSAVAVFPQSSLSLFFSYFTLFLSLLISNTFYLTKFSVSAQSAHTNTKVFFTNTIVLHLLKSTINFTYCLFWLLCTAV